MQFSFWRVLTADLGELALRYGLLDCCCLYISAITLRQWYLRLFSEGWIHGRAGGCRAPYGSSLPVGARTRPRERSRGWNWFCGQGVKCNIRRRQKTGPKGGRV